MTRESGLALLLIASLSFIVFTQCSGTDRISDAVQAAQSAEDSLATLAPVLEALEAAAAAQDSLVVGLRDSLSVERVNRANERAGFTAAIETEQAEHDDLIGQIAERVDSTTAVLLARAQAADSLIHANYERVIESQASDIASLTVELGAVTRQAAINREAWQVERELRLQAMEASAGWQSAYRGEKRKGTITKAVGIAAVVATVLIR